LHAVVGVDVLIECAIELVLSDTPFCKDDLQRISIALDHPLQPLVRSLLALNTFDDRAELVAEEIERRILSAPAADDGGKCCRAKRLSADLAPLNVP
jgi:hypothetical protein